MTDTNDNGTLAKVHALMDARDWAKRQTWSLQAKTTAFRFFSDSGLATQETTPCGSVADVVDKALNSSGRINNSGWCASQRIGQAVKGIVVAMLDAEIAEAAKQAEECARRVLDELKEGANV